MAWCLDFSAQVERLIEIVLETAVQDGELAATEINGERHYSLKPERHEGRGMK